MASKELSTDEVFQLNHDGLRNHNVRQGDAMNIITYTSSAGAGGAATEAMTVTGYATADQILAVHQKTKGANSLPLLGYTTLAASAITCVWSGDPGAGAVVVVTVRKAVTTD